MDDVRIGRYLRALRRRAGLSQAQLSARVGVGQTTVSLVERGHLDTLALRTIRRLFAGVDARVDGVVSWRGGALDRLLDERHAALVEHVVRLLTALGWRVAVELTFNHFGDRGSIDVLGFHEASGSAVVVEVKSEIASAEETNRRLDVKVRVAPEVVEREFGRRPAVVSRLLVLPESSTARRRIDELSGTFRAALPVRGVQVRRWLREPHGRIAGVVFVTCRNRGDRDARLAAPSFSNRHAR